MKQMLPIKINNILLLKKEGKMWGINSRRGWNLKFPSFTYKLVGHCQFKNYKTKDKLFCLKYVQKPTIFKNI